MTKISVVTVCYNSEKTIRKTILSVLSQKYTNFEYIIIDGDSQDTTCNIIDEMVIIAENYKIPFKVFSEKDKGVYDAMNKGALRATGEYILYMNSGDTFSSSDSLMNLCTGININEYDVIYGDTLMSFSWGKIVNKPQKLTVNNPMPFIHQSCLTKRSLLLKFPFNLKFKIIADHNLFYILKINNYKFKYISTLVSEYDASEGISSENPYLMYLEYDRIHGKNRNKLYPLVKIYYLIRYGLQEKIKKYIPSIIKEIIQKHRRSSAYLSK